MRSTPILVLLLLGACGRPDDTEDDIPAGATGTLVTAAEGGTVELQGATLVIPAGALSEDTTITADVVDDLSLGGDILATVYDFGPDGLTFAEPVELTFTADLSGDGTPVVAWHDGAAWQEVPSTVDGDEVTGLIEHFTPFTVVVRGDDQVGGACDIAGYAPCGGAIAGTWTYSAACASLKELPPLPCDTATFAITVDITGTATFAVEGTYTTDTVITTTTTIRVPKSCFPGPIDCSDLDEEAVDDGDDCLMVQSSEELDNDSGTWAAAGTSLTFDAGTEDETVMPYCASASTLTVLYQDEDVDLLYNATR